MHYVKPETVSLTSTWFIKPGCEHEALEALTALAANVQLHEPDTLTYLVNTPFKRNQQLQSLPPVDPLTVLFFETYRNVQAFEAHVNGPIFNSFVKQHGNLFVDSNGKPFTFVCFLETQAGFVRTEAWETTQVQTSPPSGTGNRHPSVMFEIIAKDQPALQNFYSKVFDWDYRIGSGGFAYIPFPLQTLPLLGGIAQANPAIPGYAPGCNFYLRVEDLEAAITQAVAAGGSRYVEPVSVDGYTFAMIKDPEGNAVGLIKPF